MAKAIIWVRSSTTKQECESQREELIKTATSEPYKFKKSDLIEIGKVGASAIKMNKVYQQEVNQLLDAIHNVQDLSTIFVWETSRLARNEKAFYAMKDEIIKNKIQLICNVPQIKLLNDNGEVNEGMEITLNLLVTLAKQEMDIKKKRFARGKKQKAKEGKFSGGRIPFGYRAYPEKDNFIDVDEKEAEIVKMIYDMYEEGYSQPRIAVELYERGYKNPRYKEPHIIQLGLVAHILTNECYTGVQLKEKVVKVKDDDEEREWIRYARKFPQLITKEQFDRCRDIAKANRTKIGKGKNIYYATKLVKCPSCGCYWSASGSKVSYQCYNAIKLPKIWIVDGRKTEQCKNNTSLSINVLDSILWYFAKREETEFILNASRERKLELTKRISEYKKKIDNIPEKIDAVAAIINKLALRNAEGFITDESFERSVSIKNKEKSELIDKKLTYQKKIEELENTIEKIDLSLKNYGVNVKPINGAAAWLDAVYERAKRFNELYSTICNITDDSERYEIIHRVIEWVSVENVKIKYKYKIGWREARAKKITIGTPNWYLDEAKNGIMLPKEYLVYYLPFNGKGKGIILDTNDSFSRSANDNDNTVEDENGNVIGHSIQYDWLYDYKNFSEAQFDDEDAPHSVSIIDIPYLNRFTDYGKNRRHEKEKEEAYKQVKDYLRIENVMAMTNLNYNQVYSAITKGYLNAINIRHKYFVSPQDAETFKQKVLSQNNNKEGNISAFEVAKRYNLNYSFVLRRIKSGIIPFEHVDGHFYVNPKDAEEYFGKINKPNL